jgi:hypothetical protein
MDGNNARMLKAGGSFRFASKAFQVCFTRPLTKADDFQGDCAIETLLPGAVNYTLAATPNLFEQLVIAKLHVGSARLLSTIVPLIKRTETRSE